MFLRLLARFAASRKRQAQSGTSRRRRVPPAVRSLESRDCPAPLTWAAGVSLPAPLAGVVGVTEYNDIFVLGGGGRAPELTVSDPTWMATEVTVAGNQGGARASGGAGITPSGAMLLFGGLGPNGDGSLATLASATLYDISGRDTDPAASMHTPRYLLGSATDANGNVYAIGGIDNKTALSSVEVYNEATNTWTLLASLPETLYSESAVADGNGHLFTFGGVGPDGSITGNVYEYTIATNTWSQIASLPVAVRDSAAVLASNGKIYVLGGTTSSGATADVESYDPSTGTWTSEAALPAPVSKEAVVSDALGRIEIMGGYDANGNAVASVWISQELNQPDAAPTITTTAPTSGATGVPYSYQVFSTANPQATYALTSAPTGMTINSVTGLIQWTPGGTQVGSFSVTMTASNYAGQTSQTWSINVVQSPPTAPTGLTVTGLTASSVSLSWNASFDPIGVAGYTVYWVYVTGHSGRGGGITTHYVAVLTVTSGTSGTVTGLHQNTQYNFVVQAYDADNLKSGYSWMVSPTTDTLPTFTGYAAGTTFNLVADHLFNGLTLSATGVPTDFSYSIVNPPTGMTVDASTGVVSWTPTDSQVGTTDVTFQVSSSAGTGGTVDYYFAVGANVPVPQFTSPTLVNGTQYATPTSPMGLTLFDNTSNTTVTWSLVSGPAGMTVDATTGAVAWTPPAGTALGTVNATFQGTNYAGSTDITVPINVVFANTVTNASLSPLKYSSTLGAMTTVTWGAPATSVNPVRKYEILVTQPGGTTGRYTTTYTFSATTFKHRLTGLGRYSYISIEVVAVDKSGDLGIPVVFNIVTS
jgi:N-acetylneuraminic acid mutarotase